MSARGGLQSSFSCAYSCPTLSWSKPSLFNLRLILFRICVRVRFLCLFLRGPRAECVARRIFRRLAEEGDSSSSASRKTAGQSSPWGSKRMKADQSRARG